jgi:hypothetical protein
LIGNVEVNSCGSERSIYQKKQTVRQLQQSLSPATMSLIGGEAESRWLYFPRQRKTKGRDKRIGMRDL